MPDIKITFAQRFKDRLQALLIKITGIEGIIFTIGTIAFFKGILPPTEWVILAATVSGVKTYQKLKQLNNE